MSLEIRGSALFKIFHQKRAVNAPTPTVHVLRQRSLVSGTPIGELTTMMSRHLEIMVSRMAEARSICRAFSTYSAHQQTSTPPATSNSKRPHTFRINKAY